MNRERRTAHLVRACYDTYVSPDSPRTTTAERLYALCKLTWITKNATGGDAHLPDNTHAVVAPALTALTGTAIIASTVRDLPDQLRKAKAPTEIVRLVAQPLGFTYFYNAFRNVALPWIAENRRAVVRMITLVASAANDRDAHEAYVILEKLPRLPRRGGGGMHAASLITPLLACLDPRRRSPIINSREGVQKRLQTLGLRRSTLGDQFHGFVGLIGQAGIRDAFDLDVQNVNDVAAALNTKPQRRAAARATSSSGTSRRLGKRDDVDVEYFRKSDRVRMRRVHNTMTNGFRRYCERRNWAVEEGSTQVCMYDALIREYDSDRHLLVEVKPDAEQATCRLAIGQLLDYRRHLPERARIDLAVLFPKRPYARAKAFLDDVGVRSLWFKDGMKAVEGFEPS